MADSKPILKPDFKPIQLWSRRAGQQFPKLGIVFVNHQYTVRDEEQWNAIQKHEHFGEGKEFWVRTPKNSVFPVTQVTKINAPAIDGDGNPISNS